MRRKNIHNHLQAAFQYTLFVERLPEHLPERGVLPPHPRFWVGAERRVLHRAVGWVVDPTETPKIIKLGFQPNLQLLISKDFVDDM